MAVTTIEEITRPGAAPADKTPGRGRRRKADRAAAAPPVRQEQDDDRDEEDDTDHLPIEPDARQPETATAVLSEEGAQDFFQKMTNYSSEQWSQMMLYVYRTAPQIDRRAAGQPMNIQKYAHPIDAERIMLDHGSGGYRIDWTSRASGRSVRLAQHYFNILNMDHPPKVPLGDWIDAPENDAWKWAKPALAEQQQTVTTPNGQTLVLPASRNTPKEFFETLKQFKEITGAETKEGQGVADRAISALIESNRQNVELARHNAAPAGEETMLVKMLMEDRRAQREELAALRSLILDKPEPKSLVEQLAELTPIINLLKPGRGNPAPAVEPDGVMGIVNKVADHIPDILSMIGMMRAGGPAAPGGPLPAPLPPFAPPAAAADPSRPADQAPAPDSFTPEQRAELANLQKRMAAAWNTYGKLIEQCAQFMVDQFTRGLTGYDFRDWFCDSWGKINWNNLKRDAGPDVMTALTQQHPKLREILTPPERVLHFFIQFFTLEGEEQVEGPTTTNETPGGTPEEN
jgi:hypothetical protein